MNSCFFCLLLSFNLSHIHNLPALNYAPVSHFVSKVVLCQEISCIEKITKVPIKMYKPFKIIRKNKCRSAKQFLRLSFECLYIIVDILFLCCIFHCAVIQIPIFL